MENEEFEKLVGCIKLADSTKREQLGADLLAFLKQVKTAAVKGVNQGQLCLVFEGEQGIGKSTLARKMAGEYSYQNIGTGVLYQDIKPSVIEYHVVEVDGPLNAGVLATLKMAITATSVTWRKPYIFRPVPYPVIGSLIVTTNDAASFPPEARGFKVFRLQRIDTDALESVDMSKIYQSI